MSDNTTEKFVALIALALLVTWLLSTTALAQQKDRNLYFQSPDGSINVIVSDGPGYVITPFPNGSGGYDGYTVSPIYPPPYSAPPASPYLQQPSPSHQYEYQHGGPAGCVYGRSGE